MLNVSHLSAEYQGKPALKDISLQIASGELVVVLGPSGCGKTTLLNLIAGFQSASSGSITLDGKPVNGPGADRGVVFQHEGLLPWRDVQSNVEFGLELAGVKKTQRRDIAQRMLSKVGLGGYEKHFIWQLSGGCASGWVSPVRWRRIHNCFCLMSLSARWMLLPANRCRNYC